MVYAYCVDKKSENGHITEYKLKDFEGNIQILKSNLLKAMVKDGSICVVNLTLTSDNKLRSHEIPTLNDLLNPEKNEDIALNLSNIFYQNRPLLHNVDPKNSFLYKHKLFYIKDNDLNVLNTTTQEVLKIKGLNRQSYHFRKNPIFIPNENCISIIGEVTCYNIDYTTELITEVIYDIYTDKYTVRNIFINIGSKRNEFLSRHYKIGNVSIISLKNKNNYALSTFILHNKFTSYIIKASSPKILNEFKDILHNAEQKDLQFEITNQISTVKLELDGYKIEINKDSKEGILTRVR